MPLTLLVAISVAGLLAAESIVMMSPYGTTTEQRVEEFSDSLKMVLGEDFKSALAEAIEKKTSASLSGDLSRYIDINFNPYRSMITAKGKESIRF